MTAITVIVNSLLGGKPKLNRLNQLLKLGFDYL